MFYNIYCFKYSDGRLAMILVYRHNENRIILHFADVVPRSGGPVRYYNLIGHVILLLCRINNKRVEPASCSA